MSQPEHPRWEERKRFTTSHAIALTLLLVLPGLAINRLIKRVASFEVTAGWHIPETTLGYLCLISVVTYLAYYRDKKKAQAEEWRIPEATLHFMEMAGGWPGAFIAQRMFRHKILKRSYQWSFWSIIAIYQFVAFEFLSDWMISRKVAELVQKQIG